ncbi:lantibiotic dehydratase [Streptomyces sp. NBC_01795]|uniref:lantibiotic dehydratase n=1 Tax=unclassified Streptomyces TaxID=2593676 RepID=UPI002DDB4D3E|nr:MULTISPECIES: lantibiotic dehydratase [unclassified Streptomyces]WSA91159.1 lantibiotic dehydratase [Streptomyces sp. NBC_01795]WSS16233.1 lantibiotic dehydratase [Streptomyces sp. NBC_01186]
MRDDHYTPQDCLFVRLTATPRTGSGGRPLGDSAAQVREVAADPLLREALHVASGSLADSLDRLDAGADLGAKRLRRTALALSRYALRAETRPTPFGLFAGVAPARAADTTQVRVSGPGEKKVRLDADWLTRRVTEWLELPAVRHGVDVVLSDLCRTRGERIVVPGNGSEVSARDTALVTWVCERTAQPVGYAVLLEQACGSFPRLTTAQVDAALFQLVRHGFLLTSITPQDLDDALYDRIAAAVAPVPGVAAELASVRAALDAYAATGPGEGRAAWRGLMRLTDPEATAARPPVHVDLRMDADLRISRAVTDEAARYASAMWDLSGEWQTHAHMRTYRDRFLEAYGTTGVVPLGQLVDRHRSIGFPSGYGERAGGKTAGHQQPEQLPKERRLLTHDLVQEALLSGDDEVRLTPGLVDRLAVGRTADAAVPPPRSLELCFQLLAESEQAIDRGDFRLLSPAYPGSWVAGATVGRFAELVGMEGELASLLAGLGDAGTVPAQVVYRPHTVRGLNMAQVPELLPHRIPVGVYADRSAPGTLDWRQLLVTPGPFGLRLILPDDGREVLPVVPHVLALDREAPPVARLLVELASGMARTWTGWNWCGLEGLPYLPRITYGRVTIFPRRWVPDRYLREAADGTSGWEEAVAAWRERYRVPDEVNLARWDRTYRVDLTDPWRREVFRQEVRGGGSLAIMEDLTDGGRGLGWSGGHSAEVVIPLARTTAPDQHQGRARRPRRPVLVPRPTDHSAAHLPGEEWLYAKFYAAEDTHDELLHAGLPTLVREVGDKLHSWHYIRYRDPEPHIRVRLHGEAEALRATALPRLAAVSRDWQETGLIKGMVLDTYRPETDRYGGPDALAHAERMFCVDSQSALAQLGMRARGALALAAPVLAAVNHALLLESLGDWDWSAWISRALPKGPAHAAYRKYQEQARSLIVPGHTAQSAAPVLGAPLAALWSTTPETGKYGALLLSGGGRAPGTEQHAEAVMAVLHMQHNRLFGIDRTGEDTGYAVLRGVARDHQGRLAHAQGGKET